MFPLGGLLDCAGKLIFQASILLHTSGVPLSVLVLMVFVRPKLQGLFWLLWKYGMAGLREGYLTMENMLREQIPAEKESRTPVV